MKQFGENFQTLFSLLLFPVAGSSLKDWDEYLQQAGQPKSDSSWFAWNSEVSQRNMKHTDFSCLLESSISRSRSPMQKKKKKREKKKALTTALGLYPALKHNCSVGG